MGNKLKIKLGVLNGVFLITCIMIYTNSEIPQQDKPPLKQYFKSIDNYKILRHIELENNAFNMLNLDDYLYTDYDGPNGKANLYIGYYYTANKAYAAHSPLICYPSQGWYIDKKPLKYTLKIGPHSIHYEEIVTSLDEDQELVIYWYQSYLRTNTKAYQNKIDMGYNKYMHKTEQHAFVRITMSLTNSTYSETKSSIIDFTKAFYPQFIDFITEESIAK